jgi:hypothetical protein
MPVSTTMSAINTEVGYSSTAQTGLNDSRVRNLANIASGAISFADCRWGIAVPAVYMFGTTSPAPYYDVTSSSDIAGYVIDLGGSNCSAQVSLSSGGTLTYQTDDSTFGTTAFTRTWLIIGSNSDYTIRLDLSSGSVTGSATGSDLALTSSRSWTVSRNTSGTNTAAGNLLLKRSGTTVITRPIVLSATVDL